MPQGFFQLIRNPIKFRLFLLAKLPSAYFSGVRVKHIDEETCKVSVPYKWFSTNPFRSTYFACLAMAAEMSTGVLAMAHTYNQNPAVSMLVLHLEASYFKKATGLTTFVSNDGKAIAEAVAQAKQTGQGQTVKAKSVGYNDANEIVAEFFVTWTFKVKNS